MFLVLSVACRLFAPLASTYLMVHRYIRICVLYRVRLKGSKVPEKLPCYECRVHMVPKENKLKLLLEQNDVSLIFQKGKISLGEI